MEHTEYRHVINAQNHFTFQSNGRYAELNTAVYFYMIRSCKWNPRITRLIPLYCEHIRLLVYFAGIYIDSCVFSPLDIRPHING